MTTFYVTFGTRYDREPHPRQPWVHPDGWLEIDADSEMDARMLVLSVVGEHWAFIYDADAFNPEYHPLGCLARIDAAGALTAIAAD